MNWCAVSVCWYNKKIIFKWAFPLRLCSYLQNLFKFALLNYKTHAIKWYITYTYRTDLKTCHKVLYIFISLLQMLSKMQLYESSIEINFTIYQFKYRTRWIKPDWDCGVMSNENRFILIYLPYAMTHTQWVGHTLIGKYTFRIIPSNHNTFDN